jgi:UMP-CMP kinase
MNECRPAKKFLIDGFPRNQDNLMGWEREMKGKVELKAVVVFHCPEEVSTGTHM